MPPRRRPTEAAPDGESAKEKRLPKKQKRKKKKQKRGKKKAKRELPTELPL
jgi:hypothetical protein